MPTRVDSLYAAYRDDRIKADLAFTGQPVHVLVVTFTVEGSDVVCHQNLSRPPVVVFRFDRTPALTSPCWIRGTCRGWVDGRVLISDCQSAGPPK